MLDKVCEPTFKNRTRIHMSNRKFFPRILREGWRSVTQVLCEHFPNLPWCPPKQEAQPQEKKEEAPKQHPLPLNLRKPGAPYGEGNPPATIHDAELRIHLIRQRVAFWQMHGRSHIYGIVSKLSEEEWAARAAKVQERRARRGERDEQFHMREDALERAYLVGWIQREQALPPAERSGRRHGRKSRRPESWRKPPDRSFKSLQHRRYPRPPGRGPHRPT
jgi:hypothetical protein